MARRTKRNPKDPRSNHGKYSSGDAPKKFTNDTSKSESKNSEATTADKTEKKEDTSQMSGDANPRLPSGNARAAVNDPEWYAKDAQLVIDAASLPFSEPMGAEIKLQHAGEIYSTDGVNPIVVADNNIKGRSVPGICTCVTKPSFGNNRYAQDPANVAMNALYAHVRYVNSGRKNYDAVDLFLYCTSLADVFSYLMWCQRIYAKAFLFSQRNKYVGEALLKSEYLDKDDLKVKLANYRYWVNTYINKVASYAVPAEISYFQRRAWVYSHIYLENPDANIKDQLYQFAPDGFYRFGLDSSGAGMLEYKTIPEIVGHPVDDSNLLSVNDIMTIGDWLLTNITGDEDFGLMSGDILKAFNGNIIGIASMPEEIDIVPVYSEYVLLQIRNATILPASRGNINSMHYDDTTGGVACYLGNMYQNADGNLWSLEGVPADATNYPVVDSINAGINKVFTVKTPTPSPIDVMEISRMTLGGYGFLALTGKDPVIKVSCGADIMVEVRITQFGYDSNNVWGLNNMTLNNNLVYRGSLQTNSFTIPYLQYLRFKYAPLLYVIEDLQQTNVPNTVNDIFVVSDVDNYTVVDWRIIARLHEVALLSMLWVPGVAKMVNF